jgi:hypothetical protein
MSNNEAQEQAEEIEIQAEVVGEEDPPAPQEEPKKEEKKTQSALAVNQSSQLIIARDNAELYRMIQVFMKGTAFPKTLDTEAKVIAAWQTAASLNLPPMVAIQNLALIHGSVAMWGQLPKALAERTGKLEDYKLILFDEAQKVICLENKNLQEKVWGSAVQVKRSGRSKNEYTFTEPEAKHAGLLNKKGPWTDYPKIMYARRATGHAMKFDFPDALMGVPVAEYDFHQAPDLKDVTPSQTRDSIIDDLEKRSQNQQGGTDGVSKS